MADVDWWARSIAIGAASAAATNVIFTGLTYRRVRPKVKVRLWRTGVSTGTERNPEASDYQFILRFRNTGTTPASVERIELVSYPRWLRTKNFERVKVQRFEPPLSPRLPIPALDGITHRFHVPTASVADSERNAHLRFHVLLSNGDTVISPKLKPDEWLMPDE